MTGQEFTLLPGLAMLLIAGNPHGYWRRDPESNRARRICNPVSRPCATSASEGKPPALTAWKAQFASSCPINYLTEYRPNRPGCQVIAHAGFDLLPNSNDRPYRACAASDAFRAIPKIGALMDTFQCISCGLHFPQMLDYYRHRIVEDGSTRCLPIEQMHAAAIKTAPKKVHFDESRLFTKPTPRKRIEFTPKPAIALARAMWLMRRGVSIERLTRLGVDGPTMSNALKALEAEEMQHAPN